MTRAPLTPDQSAAFARDGWLVLRGALDRTTLDRLRAWVEQLDEWAALDGPGLHHFEQTDGGPRLARSEDLVPHHPGLRGFICEGDIIGWVGDLLDEPAVLYKEKVNYKAAGGAGFAPHQDATAYRFVDHHISVMVPVDAATPESGGLSFARGFERGTLPNEAGRITADVADKLDWIDVSVYPGDVVLFDSYAPHRSGTNTSGRPRRAFYLTYNAASKGDFRERYYADKRAEFAAEGHDFGGERARISVNDDFLGKPAPRPAQHRPRPIQELFDRFHSPQADQLYDEAITELEHGLQCGALARRDGADDATIAAALLHDVGHLLIGDLFPIEATLEKDWKHEDVGARYLARWFGPEVTEPVRMHVAAKRYLVARDAAYFAGLSPSSVRSLEVQGGPMSAEECAAFEAAPGFAAAVAVRRWDDEGKDPELHVPGFSAYEALLRGLERPATAGP
jgi:phosphonate degradation associated HDIG domain protein